MPQEHLKKNKKYTKIQTNNLQIQIRRKVIRQSKNTNYKSQIRKLTKIKYYQNNYKSQIPSKINFKTPLNFYSIFLLSPVVSGLYLTRLSSLLLCSLHQHRFAASAFDRSTNLSLSQPIGTAGFSTLSIPPTVHTHIRVEIG